MGKSDSAPVGAEVRHYELLKRDKASGEVFEIVEGGDGRPDRVTFRKAGQPPASYADLPYEPKEETP